MSTPFLPKIDVAKYRENAFELVTLFHNPTSPVRRKKLHDKLLQMRGNPKKAIPNATQTPVSLELCSRSTRSSSRS